MTLVDLFNSFHDATRRCNLTSDARSLFLAFMQHWNAQRRPQAVDISVGALRETAKLDEESYRRAAICLSNLKFWRMKRKAHAKDGRLIAIGEFFLKQNSDRREIDAKPAFSASPPTPPSERELKPPSAVEVPPEEETKQSTARAHEENPPEGGFSVDWFRGKTFNDVYKNPKATQWLQIKSTGDEYNAIFAELQRNSALNIKGISI